MLQELSNKKFILIDNDKIIRMSWEIAAKKAAINLSTFSNSQDFFEKESTFTSHNTIIYIDYELDNGVNGIEEAKKIFDLGYKEIFLATGYQGDDIVKPDYIKEIVGKRAPFE